jgi:hypothetical protein
VGRFSVEKRLANFVHTHNPQGLRESLEISQELFEQGKVHHPAPVSRCFEKVDVARGAELTAKIARAGRIHIQEKRGIERDYILKGRSLLKIEF